MLSTQEQRVWDDIQRFWAETAEEPVAGRRAAAFMRKRARRERGEPPGWAVGCVWIAIFLVLFDAVVAGLVLGAVTGLGWALWRYWPKLTGRGTGAATLPVTGKVREEESWHRRRWETGR